VNRERVRPDLVLCSPARRTRETLERIAPALGRPVTEVEPGLYAASAPSLLERLRRLPEPVGSVMLVGHNPGLHELAILLAGKTGAELEDRFPTGALATLTHGRAWNDLGRGTATLQDFVVPRELD
jgi:phosphohistidine phosphatase